MWAIPLYAVNMAFFPRWLIKKLLWPMAGQNIEKQEIKVDMEGKEGGVREMPYICPRSRCNKPQASW